MPEPGDRQTRWFDPNSSDAIPAAIVDGIGEYAPPFAAVTPRSPAPTFTWTRTTDGVLPACRDARR